MFERLTLHLAVEATYDNPFDVDDVNIEAHVTGPDTRWTVPAFFYAPYERNDSARSTRLTSPAGPPSWLVRLSFPRPGKYEITVAARDRSGVEKAESVAVNVTDSDAPGHVRRGKSDHRYFVTDRGETYFAVGANVCWGETWSRDFDILIDEQKIATERLNQNCPGQFFTVTYDVPPELTKDKTKVTAKSKAHQWRTAGDLFECRTVKAD